MATNEPTVADLLNRMAADFCDNYCKFPEQYGEDQEEQLYKHCENCPLNLLGI